MSIYKKLKPHIHVIELLGGTGDGKTETATVPATPQARKILLKGVGKTNSTLKERLLVYSSAYTDKMIVAAKLDSNIISRNRFTEIITKALATVVKRQGKVVASIVGKDEEDLAESLKDEINKKNNIKAMFSFLSDKQKEEFINHIVALYKDYDLSKYNYNIYNTVKNSMPDSTEVKENSKKFLSAIQSEVERILDMMQNSFKNDLWKELDKVNNQLKDEFFKYFNRNDISDDEYFYKEILLDNPDEEFINAMFTANDIQSGERLSLEVMCSEIVIYIPMNEKIAKIIEMDSTTNEVFRDSYGNLVFGILDTRGLYHADNTEDENTDYCSDLVYRSNIDALVMVVPLFGDSNEKKINELYKDIIKTFNKHTR